MKGLAHVQPTAQVLGKGLLRGSRELLLARFAAIGAGIVGTAWDDHTRATD